MEQRKEKEISYYNKAANNWLKKDINKNIDIDNCNIEIFSSYKFCKDWLKKNIEPKIKFLDYGCGHGMHLVLPAKLNAQVYGIDLSENSLEIAKKRIKKEGIKKQIKLIKMDCESLNFPDNYFDIIWDGGTLSSLDVEKSFAELKRVLSPQGKIIGIETFGHNPLANLKRWINKKMGRRTSWAISHIIKNKDLKTAKKYFKIENIYYFHLCSMFVFPFTRFSFGKKLFRFFDKIDYFLLKIPFLKKYAFKVVFIFSKLENHA